MTKMAVQGQIASRTNADSVEIFQPFMGMEPEEFKKLARSVLVCIPHRPSEGIHGGLVDNIGRWAILGTPTARVNDEFEGFIELTRGGLVRTFLQYCEDNPDIEYCLMIDNDESVEWDTPYKLAQWGKDIVSGIICSFSPKKGGVFACVTIKDKYGVARFPTVTRSKTLPARGLREIESAGTGLLCVHKRVFKKIVEAGESPFFIPEDVRRHCVATGTLKLGEDMAFSQRAKEYGFKMYVDFSVRGTHYKTMAIQWPEKAVDHEVKASEWMISDEDYIHE